MRKEIGKIVAVMTLIGGGALVADQYPNIYPPITDWSCSETDKTVQPPENCDRFNLDSFLLTKLGIATSLLSVRSLLSPGINREKEKEEEAIRKLYGKRKT